MEEEEIKEDGRLLEFAEQLAIKLLEDSLSKEEESSRSSSSEDPKSRCSSKTFDCSREDSPSVNLIPANPPVNYDINMRTPMSNNKGGEENFTSSDNPTDRNNDELVEVNCSANTNQIGEEVKKISEGNSACHSNEETACDNEDVHNTGLERKVSESITSNLLEPSDPNVTIGSDRCSPDIVHHRLSNNSRIDRNRIVNQNQAGAETGGGYNQDITTQNLIQTSQQLTNHQTTSQQLTNHEVLHSDDQHPQPRHHLSVAGQEPEFRNRSVENLKSKDDNSLRNGTIKQRMRKGLSVNDISECSVVANNDKHHPASVKMTFLRTFGLSRRANAAHAPRDEVTQRVTSDPGGTLNAFSSLSVVSGDENHRLQGVEQYRSGAGGSGRSKIKNIKKTISNIFQFKGHLAATSREGACGAGSCSTNAAGDSDSKIGALLKFGGRKKSALAPSKRALPPVPSPSTSSPAANYRGHESRTPSPNMDLLAGGGVDPAAGEANISSDASPRLETGAGGGEEDSSMDFPASIEKVKDHGWYWGPLSGEAAERILAAEPDGSFVVRDSSDQHYIFSLTFKLNGFVRHVRIEHDQGNFSFGSFTKFKSTTIVDFIENAVEHSRSGRYLFFLHRRPVLGPMRVQLLHPVSRFKRVQSLQHLCRYVIVKLVRKDHLESLPIPNRIKTYLNTPFYYSEQVAEENEESGVGINLEDVLQNEQPNHDNVPPHQQPRMDDHEHNEITETERALHTTNDNNRDSHSNSSSTEGQSTNNSELTTDLPTHQEPGADTTTDIQTDTTANVDGANIDDDSR